MVEIERREFLEGAYLRVSFLLFRKKMPFEENSNRYAGHCKKCGKSVKGSYQFCFHCNKERNQSSGTKRQRSNEFETNNA